MDAQEKDRILKGMLDLARARRLAGDALADYAPDTLAGLQQQPGVEEVRDYAGSDITVRFEDQTQVTVLLGRELHYGGAPGPSGEAAPAETPTYASPDYPEWSSTCVIDPLWDDWPPQSTPLDIKYALIEKGYDIAHFKGDSVDLAYMAGLAERRYGVIFMRTHGGVMWVGGDAKLHIMVRPFFDSYPPSSGYTGVGVFLVGTDWGDKYAYAFNDQFVSTYMSGTPFPNTLMHLLVCFGAATDAQNDMIPAFLSRGVGCYSGWTLTASSTYGDPAAVTFFTRLKNGDTVAEAIALIAASGSSPDPDTSAVLVAHGNSGMHLQMPYIGNKRSWELHKPTCSWRKKMNPDNVVLYASVADAQADGFNGCAFCLPKYNTG